MKKVLFDTFRATKPARLMDGELRPDVEERPDATPIYTLKRRKPRPFRSPTGEIVMRRRGGKGFARIYESWDPSGLLRIRGELLAVWKSTEDCGRALDWVSRFRGWKDQPTTAPYVIRQVVILALKGADVSGCNLPGVADYVAGQVEANRRAGSDVVSLGPKLDDKEPAGEFSWGPVPRTCEQARALYKLDMLDGKQKADRHRVKTTEYRNEHSGEYGPETKMQPDGRVLFRKKLPWLNIADLGGVRLKDYTQKRRLKNGQRLYAQRSVVRNKPGPKPQNGFTMSARIRKAKQRCKEKGVPFVIAEYLKKEKV